MPALTRPQGSLHYIIEGPNDASVTVVLVHGLCCAQEDWSAQVTALAPKYRVIALDLRGHGDSDFEAGFDIPTFGEDLVALLEARDVERAVLVGHSMGCRVVLQAATLAPGRVRGVVLLDGSRFAAGNPARAHDQARTFIATNGGWHNVVRQLFAAMFLDGTDPAYVSDMVERAARVQPEVGAGVFASMMVWDASELEPALDALTVPLTAVQSTYVNEDRKRVPLKVGDTNPWLDLLRQRVQQAHVEIVPGVGHFTQIEAPDSVSGAIEQTILRSTGNP